MAITEQKLANYNSVRGAEAYKRDYETKLHRKMSDKVERAIYRSFFKTLGRCESVLDLPCGAGRLFSMVQEHTDQVIEADYSETMLQLNRSDHDAAARAYVRCSGLQIALPDNAVDVVMSIRLSHHIHTPQGREQHMNELFRVARRGVIVSWFSATSLKAVLRNLRSKIQDKKPKNTMHKKTVERIARENGFRRADMRTISRISSGHIFGLFVNDAQ